MVLFGGFNGTTRLNDTWVLSLDGDPVWTQLSPIGGPPAGRSVHSAIYDPVRDRMIIFGGSDDSPDHYAGDVWALSLAGTPQWVPMTPGGGTIHDRGAHSAIYDPVRDRMLVYGGFDGVNVYDDLWSLTLAGTIEWQLLATVGGPGTLDSHRATYEPANDAMILFGGSPTIGIVTNDVWSLHLAAAPTPTWTKLSPLGTPPPAGAYAMAFDAVRQRALVFAPAADSVWALDLSGEAWTLAAPTGITPGARFTTAIYDDAGARMVIFGELASGQRLNDTWDFHWCTACASTAAATWLVAAAQGGSVVLLTWNAPDPTANAIAVERRAMDTGWTTIGRLSSGSDAPLSYEDRTVIAGQTYAYRLAILVGSEWSYTNEVWVTATDDAAPRVNWIAPGRPNPFASGVQLSMFLTESRPVRLVIYDALGRRTRTLVDGVTSSGWSSAWWDGKDDRGTPARSGLYFARLEWENRSQTRKIVLAR